MKPTILFAILVSLMLIGCAAEDTTQQPTSGTDTQKPAETPEEQPTQAVQKVEQKDPELTEEQKQKALDKLKPSIMDALAIPEYYKVMDAGDSHAFAFALTNALTEENYFRVKVYLKQAIDHTTSPIQGADEDTLGSWIKEDEFIFTLIPGEEKVLPIIVNVGDEIGPGVEIKPGSYVFNIEVFYNDYEGSIKKKYSDTKTLTIRVK